MDKKKNVWTLCCKLYIVGACYHVYSTLWVCTAVHCAVHPRSRSVRLYTHCCCLVDGPVSFHVPTFMEIVFVTDPRPVGPVLISIFFFFSSPLSGSRDKQRYGPRQEKNGFDYEAQEKCWAIHLAAYLDLTNFLFSFSCSFSSAHYTEWKTIWKISAVFHISFFLDYVLIHIKRSFAA